MTMLELIKSYGPAVFADSETGVIIQRNGAYLIWSVEVRDGWHHVDCRNVEENAYDVTLAKAQDSAEEWFREVMAEAAED